jgi:hypothetical protein
MREIPSNLRETKTPGINIEPGYLNKKPRKEGRFEGDI